MNARTLHANLHLLDRQLIDTGTGRLLGKVDDLELDLVADPPRVSAILTGPQALGPRLPGLLGRAVIAIGRLLHPDPDPGPIVIPAGMVTDVDSAVHIATHGDLPLTRLADWVDQQVIGRIPGATDAPD